MSTTETIQHIRKGIFQLDPLGDELFEGYTTGETWNGFACPLFRFDQAQKLAAAWRSRGWVADYDPDSDQFVFDSTDPEAQHEPEIFPSVEFAREKYYPIGAHCWVWWDVSWDE